MSWLLRTLLSALLPALVVGNVCAADGVVVFAAASLEDSLTAAADAYAASGEPRPRISFGSTSILARQVESGAPADLFLSADEQWMDYLVARDLVVFGTRADFLASQLVLVASALRPFRMEIVPHFPLAGLLADDKLAMANPDLAPAGRYGKAALTSLGVWQELESKIVRSADVRGALLLVEKDEARAAIVYSTDALASRKVVLVGIFPEDSHPPVVYPLAIVTGHDRPEVRKFREFLLSPQAKTIFQRFGFQPK